MIRYEPPEDVAKWLEKQMEEEGRNGSEIITEALLAKWRMRRCKVCSTLFEIRHGRQLHCIACMIKRT